MQCAVLQAIIEEMRTGKPFVLPKEGMARTKLAAGPTTIEDLVRDPQLVKTELLTAWALPVKIASSQTASACGRVMQALCAREQCAGFQHDTC